MKDVILVNREKCIGCGACIKDCPAGYLSMQNEKAATGKFGCIECGHCYAVCPVEAIEMKGYSYEGCDGYASMTEIDSDTLLTAMKSRRTIRQYKDTPVEEEKINKILEAGRYCPTAKNSQNIAYTVLMDCKDELEAEAVKLFRAGKKVISPFSESLKKHDIPDDFFFKGAQLVIIVSSSSTNDAALACSYMELMAESLGLGVLYSGFFVAATKLSPKIRKTLDLPVGHKAVNCMIMGYPDVKYHRIAPRKEINVKYK